MDHAERTQLLEFLTRVNAARTELRRHYLHGSTRDTEDDLRAWVEELTGCAGEVENLVLDDLEHRGEHFPDPHYQAGTAPEQ